MKFAIAQAGDTLERLSQRLFRVCSKADLERATQLIGAANPKLSPDQSLPLGTVVIVPSIADLEPTNDVQTGSRVAVSLIQSLRQQLVGGRGPGRGKRDDAKNDPARPDTEGCEGNTSRTSALAEALTHALDRQEQAALATLELAKSDNVHRLARTQKVVKERLGTITKAAATKLEHAKALRDLQQKALTEVESDLDGLLQSLAGGSLDSGRHS